MPARKFTDEQEQEICRRYLAGESTPQLAKVYETTPRTIGLALRRNQIEARPLRKFTNEQEQEIARRYLAGETTEDIARSFPACTRRTINQAIHRQGGTLRTTAESRRGTPNLARRKFTSEQEAEICERYLKGEGAPSLAAAFDASPKAIFGTLKRNGLRSRSVSEARLGRPVLNRRSLSEAQALEVCARYQAGESTVELAKAYAVASSSVGHVLDRHGIARRSIKEANGGLSDEQEREACKRYKQGESTYELAADFGVADRTIGAALERHGIERRSARKFTDEQELEICKRYEQGEGTAALSEEFGSNVSTVWKIIRRNGFLMRRSGRDWDSVDNLLEAKGNFALNRECCFYLFELTRYSKTHCKPGIAFDVDRRADEEYGEEVLRLVFATRAEAYFLEQAVLDATCGSADCPDDLQDWGGATEIRAMPAQDMLPIVLRLADELDDLGMWEFAARYVPMTAAQRAQCQQRALQSVAVITEQEG